MTTAFPVSEAIPNLEPGAYVLAANVLPKKGDDNHQAIQWFIVSDLGLTVFSGDDGVHGFVRSLATAGTIAGATCKLVARNNEILATATTDANGYVRFDAGLKRGEGGLAPAMLTAETRDGDYAFLDLATAAFDLTDRGVKGRDAPGPIDAYVFAERGVYRPGETVNVTALVRDRAGRAQSLPVTAIIQRPDGVEHRRVVLADQGHGGRSHALNLGAQAMSGTWRVKIHTDPKADPNRGDRVPGRGFPARTAGTDAWIGDAAPRASIRRPQSMSPAAISMARPQPTLRSRARSSSSRRRAMSKASPAIASAWPTRRSHRCASRSKSCPPQARTARRVLPSRCRRSTRPRARWKRIF